MKKTRKSVAVIFASLMLAASSVITSMAAPAITALTVETPQPRGNYISSGSATLTDKSGTSVKLGISGDTLAHYSVTTIGLSLTLEYKAASNGSIITVDTWDYTASNTDTLSKSFNYYPSYGAGYYRLTGYHYVQGSTYYENLDCSGSWIYVD